MNMHRPLARHARAPRRTPGAGTVHSQAPELTPAPDLASLRDPVAPAAVRAEALPGLQRALGNAAVARALAAERGERPALAPSHSDRLSVATTPQPARAAHVQRGFFGKLWKGVKSVGKAIGKGVATAAKGIAKGVAAAAKGIAKGAVWIAKKAVGLSRDMIMYVFNALRDLPARLARVGKSLIDGLVGSVKLIPEAIGALVSGGLRGLGNWLLAKAKSGAVWVGTLVSRLLDLVGGPEAAELILHLLTASTTPLSSTERGAAASVLGPGAVRWNDVRVNEGGLLQIIFHFNKDRAFTTFHTINIPSGTRSHIWTIVHELTHVYQYELVGSLYIGQAIHAQAVDGQDAYQYGDLKEAYRKGKHLRDFNREAQAQIAEDYFLKGHPASHEPYIKELQAGAI